jgi:hypothetical protein
MDTQPPLEDISAVVSRFQAWAGAQAPAHAKHGVRELTYEEAIRSSRRRTAPVRATPKAKTAEPVPAAQMKRKTVVETPAVEPARPKKQASSRRARKSARKSKTLPPAKAKTQAVSLQPPAVFRQMLAEQVAPRSIVSAQALAVERRTTALSLRLSSGEHSLLKARAAEANLSVSVYLRTCVFEVEELRAQLRRLRMAQENLQVQTSVLTVAFASWAQFVRRLFHRKTTALAVRA